MTASVEEKGTTSRLYYFKDLIEKDVFWGKDQAARRL